MIRMGKRLSIVIPTYNMEKYLRRCLDSLIIEDKNLFDMMEVLIINDGSLDASSQIAHEYEKRHSNVFKVIDKENGNYGSCINKGIDESTGEFFKILDADDWYDGKSLKSLLLAIDNYHNEVDAFFTEFSYHRDKIVNYKYRYFKYDRIYNLRDVDFVGSKDIFMLKMYGISIKTSILKDIGLRHDTGISYTDYEFIYFPYPFISKVIFLPFDVYQYYIGREGQTVSALSAKKHLNDYYIIANRFLKDFNSIQINKEEHNIMKVKEYLTIMYCLAFIDRVIGYEYDINKDMQLRNLYSNIKKNKRLLYRMSLKSPFFLLWQVTKLYKVSKPVLPFYKLVQFCKRKIQ